MISLKHGFLFIHIPKTAGNSIQNILKDYSEEKIVSITPYQDGVERFEIRSDSYNINKHSTLLEYQEQLGKEEIEGLFKFTCVRNPWERMISFYFSPHRSQILWDRSKFVDLVKTIEPITKFISLGEDTESEQSCFANMDYYIRFEELKDGVEFVCKRIGIETVLPPWRNASVHNHYSSYYDTELIKLVNDKFSEEIRYFDFAFVQA